MSMTIESNRKLQPMPSGALSESVDLKNSRFVTGERLQPMFKNNNIVVAKKKKNLKPIDSNLKTQNSLRNKFTKPLINPEPPLQAPSSRISSTPEYQENIVSLVKFDINVDSRILNIEDQLKNLQSKLTAFESMCKPLKELEEEPKKVSKKLIEQMRRKYAARKIQRAVKKWLRLRRHSAIRIQSKYKEHRDLKNYLSIKNSRKQAAIKIQKWIRPRLNACKIDSIPRHTSPKSPKTIKNKLIDESCQTDLNSAASSRVTRTQIKFESKKRLIDTISQSESPKAKLAIESISLGVKSPQRVKTKNLFQTLALIQAHIRRFQQQSKYKIIKKKVIRVQSIIRMHQTYKLYKGIKEAVIFIQKNYRGYLVRKGKFVEM